VGVDVRCGCACGRYGACLFWPRLESNRCRGGGGRASVMDRDCNSGGYAALLPYLPP
jgi:hypothetical protein